MACHCIRNKGLQGLLWLPLSTPALSISRQVLVTWPFSLSWTSVRWVLSAWNSLILDLWITHFKCHLQREADLTTLFKAGSPTNSSNSSSASGLYKGHTSGLLVPFPLSLYIESMALHRPGNNCWFSSSVPFPHSLEREVVRLWSFVYPEFYPQWQGGLTSGQVLFIFLKCRERRKFWGKRGLWTERIQHKLLPYKGILIMWENLNPALLKSRALSTSSTLQIFKHI